METFKIKGHDVEYWEEDHTYLVDGLLLPSITTILKSKFGDKYNNIDEEVLKRASEKGTTMHKVIQDYEEEGFDDIGNTELHNYKFLKRNYHWKVLKCEVPVILFDEDKPIAVGRLDQVIQIGDELGINDLKRTSTFDKEYVAYQTNLYRIAYQQTYGEHITFVCGTHLRDNKRKFYKLPIKEKEAMELVRGWKNV